MEYLIAYLLVINLVGFIAYGSDKKRSEKGSWRIKESTLLIFSLIGGGFGSILGMKVYRHKTQKKKFQFGVPILTAISIVIVYFIITLLNLQF